jgi:hypothetical protein
MSNGRQARITLRWRDQTVSAKPLAIGVGALASFLLIAYVVLELAPNWFAETQDLDADQRASARQGVRTASLALLAGAVGVVGAAYTARTFALNRAGQITDRFTRAIDQLGNKDALAVRLGGIYALERIARDSKQDHAQVFEVLTAYVREHAARQDINRPQSERPPPGPPPWAMPRFGTDLQAVLTVIGRRTLAHEDDGPAALHLSYTDLRHATLARGQFSHVNLLRADLGSADCQRAKLAEAILFGADLRETDLMGASLTGALMADTLCQQASFKGADLTGADFALANLSGADFTEADLKGANVAGAGYDDATTWPNGFDPEAAGAIRIEGGGENPEPRG